MIAKHISMRTLKKSDYAGLLQYLLEPQNKNERVGEVRATNCESMDPAVATIEVLNTQSLNRRATGDKTYHLILSFRAGEQPDTATLRALEGRVCAALGYAEHQRISVVHHDTDNLHVHIAINKIHPARHTMHSPYNDHITLGKVCETLEREFGLQRDNHTARKHRADNHADDMEQHAGVESLLGWIKRECWDEIRGANSWNALHDVMHAHGLRLHARGNGLVVTADDGTTVKASSLDREFSKSKLEERFGQFQPGPEAAGDEPCKRYEHRPFRFHADTTALFKRYQELRALDRQGSTRADEWAAARERKNRRIAAAKLKGKFKRSVIKLLSCDRISRRILFAAVGSTLLSEIEQINREYFKERERIYQKHKRGTWADWLHTEAQQGSEEALSALRSRHGAAGLRGNALTGRHCHKAPRADGIDGVTKHGTVIICAGTTVLRDDGSKLAVTRGFEQAGLQTALRLAAERYGACLRVDGTDEFREQIARAAASARLSITFDDAALEARRLELIQAATTKESHDETRQQPRQGRPADSSIQTGGRNGATVNTTRATNGGKPNVGGVGKKPPPESQDRLRKLSQLGMVCIPSGGAVLLPGDVPGHVEQQGSTADHRMRRSVSGAGRIAGNEKRGTKLAPSAVRKPTKAARHRTGQKPPPAGRNRLHNLQDLGGAGSRAARWTDTQVGDATVRPGAASTTSPVAQHEISAISASMKYVFEREQRRRTFFDIPKHLAYDGFQGQAAFAGLRTVDAQLLALLKRGNEIVVVPIDDATGRRLKRLARGDMVTVAGKGVIRTKGRSR